MKLRVPIKKFEYDLWSYYLAIPKDQANAFIEGEDRRVVCTLFGEHIHSALMPKGAICFIYLKKHLRTSLKGD